MPKKIGKICTTLERSPSADCLIENTPKAMSSSIKTQGNFKSYLKKLKHNNLTQLPFFESRHIKKIMHSVEEEDQIEVKKHLADFFVNEKNSKSNKNPYGCETISEIIQDVKNRHQADFIKKMHTQYCNNGSITPCNSIEQGIKKVIKGIKTEYQGKLAQRLISITNTKGQSIFCLDNIALLTQNAKTRENADVKLKMLDFVLEKKNSLEGLNPDTPNFIRIINELNNEEQLPLLEQLLNHPNINISECLSFAQTPAQIEFSKTLINLKGNEGKTIFDNEILSVFERSRSLEELSANIKILQDEDYTDQLKTIPQDLAKKMLNISMSMHKKIDISRIKKLFEFIDENKLQLQAHGENAISKKDVLNLFNENFITVCEFLDDNVIKNAIQLKLNDFKSFIDNCSELKKTLSIPQTEKLLKTLAQYTAPGQKVEKLNIFTTLNELEILPWHFDKMIALMKEPKVSPEQKKLANEIFTSSKPYQEQIQEFMEKFNVSDASQKKLKLYLEKYNLQNSIITNETNSQKTLSNKALQTLCEQIEHHINIVNNNQALNQELNKIIFEEINIDLHAQGVRDIHFDLKYIPKLFNALTNPDFLQELEKLISLVQQHPQKSLLEIKETLPHNQKTKELFNSHRLNYERWTTFDKNAILPFSIKIDADELIKTIEKEIAQEFCSKKFESLPAEIKLEFTKALKDNGFELSASSVKKLTDNPATKKDLEKITSIVKELINKNENFWEKPLQEKSLEDNKLQIKEYFLKKIKRELSHLNKLFEKEMSLGVRLSDVNNIGRNLFIGNHVSCCTAVERQNGFAAPQRLLNSFSRMIEIVDKSGTSHGKSMCYFAEVNGKLSFIVDCLEVNGNLMNDSSIPDMIEKYAKEITKQIANSEEIPIYFGPAENKFKSTNFKQSTAHTIKIIGNSDSPTYVSVLGGTADINTIFQNKNLLIK